MPGYRLEVSGVLPLGLQAELARRFGPIEVQAIGGDTVLRLTHLDQAGLRALLDLVWEVGGRVLRLVPDDRSGIDHPG